MYLLLALLLLILIILLPCAIFQCRRKRVIKKICCMRMDEKCKVLDNLLEPFGYAYVPSQDIFTSRIDAWQRQFGYSAFYDKAASHFGMIIDSLPVYFDYDNRTWLIEFWKGQYGINTGCEIGIYYADRILGKDELDHTLFKSVSNEDIPDISLVFYKLTSDKNISHLSGRHWWLTTFKPGLFSIPSGLALWSSVTLKSHEMAVAFYNALIKLGYSSYEINIYRNTVTFTFAGGSATIGSMLHKLRISAALYFNRLLCKIFLLITRPFTLSSDRVLYMYYYLPFIFRRMLNIRKIKGCKK